MQLGRDQGIKFRQSDVAFAPSFDRPPPPFTSNLPEKGDAGWMQSRKKRPRKPVISFKILAGDCYLEEGCVILALYVIWPTINHDGADADTSTSLRSQIQTL